MIACLCPHHPHSQSLTFSCVWFVSLSLSLQPTPLPLESTWKTGCPLFKRSFYLFRRGRENWLFRLLVHSPNAPYSQGCFYPKPGVRNWVQVFRVGVREIQTLQHSALPPRVRSQTQALQLGSDMADVLTNVFPMKLTTSPWCIFRSKSFSEYFLRIRLISHKAALHGQH